MSTNNWEHSSWKYVSLIGDEQVVSPLAHQGLRILRFCIVSWKDEREPSIKKMHGNDSWIGSKDSLQYRTLDTIDGEPKEFEWNIFPGFTTLQLCHKVQELLSRSSVTPEKFTGRIIFMSLFNDITWGSTDNERVCIANATLVSLFAKYVQQGVGHSSHLDQKRSGILHTSVNHEENGTESAELMMIKFGESGHPVFRATSPLSRGVLKGKGGGKLSIHYCAGLERIDWNCFSNKYFCKSAQYLRGSRRNVWRIWILSR